MSLAAIIAMLIVAGLLAWASERWGTLLPRLISLAALGLASCVAAGPMPADFDGRWYSHVRWPWIPRLGIDFHLGADGLSVLLIFLTLFLGILSVLCSWREITEKVGFFHLNLLWILAGILGVFAALDLFLFMFFWELMLVPMYFLIILWGHGERVRSAIKFFLFTQAGGLLMFVSIVMLAVIHYEKTGALTFDYLRLLGTPVGEAAAKWLMAGFLAAFLVKLPAFPLHTWLPDAHTDAPTAGSVVLAGLLLKTGAYGILRFAIPFFPAAADAFAPAMMVLGTVGIIYGAVLAFAQTDFKRLVAYTSVSHMGFVLLGLFAASEIATRGAVMQMICHGLSTPALFILAGILYERLGTREMDRMGGLWETAPRMGAIAMVLVMASLGLPGLGNFVAEFLVLVGSYPQHAAVAVVATVGLVGATIYSLAMMQRSFHGPNRLGHAFPDLTIREAAVFATLVAALVWLGLYPQPVFDFLGRTAHVGW